MNRHSPPCRCFQNLLGTVTTKQVVRIDPGGIGRSGQDPSGRLLLAMGAVTAPPTRESRPRRKAARRNGARLCFLRELEEFSVFYNHVEETLVLQRHRSMWLREPSSACCKWTPKRAAGMFEVMAFFYMLKGALVLHATDFLFDLLWGEKPGSRGRQQRTPHVQCKMLCANHRSSPQPCAPIYLIGPNC